MIRNRRREKRVDIQSGIYVWNEIEDSPLGQLANISRGGLMVITDQPLPTDAVYQVYIQGRKPSAALPRFSLGVETLWTHPGPGHHSYWVGMRIIDISEEGKALLRQLMDLQGA
ncbi:MAG: PilZ domain-containing protein [Chromatiales bacterium]|jgi:hypothetical protein